MTRTKGGEQGGSFFHRALSCFLLLVAGAVLYVVFYAPYFHIEKVVVIDNQKITGQQIEKVIAPILDGRVWGVLPGRTIAFADTGAMRSKLLSELLVLDTVRFEKQPPDILKITVTEKEPAAVWIAGNKNYYLDRFGVVAYEYNPFDETVNKKLPIIRDEAARYMNPRDKAVSAQVVAFALAVWQQCKEKTGKDPELFLLPSSQAGEIRLKLKDSFTVYFTLDRTAESQLDDLALLLKDQIKNRKVDYVDMRVENWVYYK